jgi:hypothetical protein
MVKVGVFVTGEVIPLWIFRLLKKLVESDYASVTHFFIITQADTEVVRSKPGPWIYRFHEKFDLMISKNRVDFHIKVKIWDLCRDLAVDRFTVNSISICNEETELINRVLVHELDVILNFTTFNFDRIHTRLAQNGIWKYHLSNCYEPANIKPTYYEFANKLPEIKIEVEAEFGNSERSLLHQTWISTNFHSLSINLNHVYCLSTLLIPRLIYKLVKSGPAQFKKSTERITVTENKHIPKISFKLSEFEAFVNFARVTFRYLFRRMVFSDKTDWSLMFKKETYPFPGQGHFQSIASPFGINWADPFVIQRDGKTFLFVEELNATEYKGYIVALEMGEKGEIVQSWKILEKKYHISYPFIFEWNNQLYMIPETSADRTIQLYRCDRFPDKWTFIMNLMENVVAMDTTLFHHAEKWWMFTSICESECFPEHHELFLYSSTDLLTANWKSHPLNPIVHDIRNSRAAGRIFKYEDRFYRPAQDCAGQYGKAIQLNEITLINELEYEEKLVKRYDATWKKGLIGTHTFNFNGPIMAIDVSRLKTRLNIITLCKGRLFP